MVRTLAHLPRRAKQAIMIANDMVLLSVIVWAAFALRLETLWPRQFAEVWWLGLAVPALTLPIFIRFGLYRAVIRYLGSQALISILQAVSLSALLFIALVAALRIDDNVPRTAYALYWMLGVLAVGGTRFLARTWFQQLLAGFAGSERVAVYGAGAAGVQLAQALHAAQEYEPICFVDDDPTLQGKVVNGLMVYAPSALPRLVDRRNLQMVLLAIPSARRSRRRQIVEQLHDLNVAVKAVPGMKDVLTGRARIDDLREVQIEDLLGRDPVTPSPELMDRCIRDKVVMVTGAGGSIGSELCRQILMRRPKTLILFEQNEFALYTIEQDLTRDVVMAAFPARIVPLLGSVLDQPRLERVMTTFGVHTVYHAAAYKHVPIVEENVLQSVENNIFGTVHAARAAEAAGVERFVLISTDKAVRPTNVMGATKRFAELVLQAMADAGSATCFSMVRFGNVLGSSGSVVPLFRQQIAAGGPVTVTHPEVTRYFMTIPEAAALVIQAGAMGQGGDVFVLDMGEPVNIHRLARQMIHLSGLEVQDEQNPHGDIPIVFTGLRPGEKLYEELLIGNNPSTTRHPMIMRAEEGLLSLAEVSGLLDKLLGAFGSFDAEAARGILERVVDGYEANGASHDLLWGECGTDAELAPETSRDMLPLKASG